MGDQSGKVVRMRFKDVNALHSAYMSFLRNGVGGLYVPLTGDLPAMGSPIFLLVQIPDSQEIFPASGNVCFIADGRKHGVGIMFNNDDHSKRLRVQIENTLGALVSSPTMTLTM